MYGIVIIEESCVPKTNQPLSVETTIYKDELLVKIIFR